MKLRLIHSTSLRGARIRQRSLPLPLSAASLFANSHSDDALLAVRHLASVSSDEVEKFSGMDKDWWDPKKNILIPMNTIRMKYIRQMVEQHLSKTKISNAPSLPFEGLSALDIGCGGGLLSESLARLGSSVTGLDPSERLVEAAKQHATLDERTRNIDYQGGKTIEDFSQEQPSKKYDIVCLLEVLEHSTDASSLLRASSALLKDDGLLFLSTINRTIKSYFGTIIGAEYVMRYIPVGTHDWHQYRSPAEVNYLMNHTGLDQVDASGMVITKPPFFGDWSWKLDPGDTDMNWIATYRKKQQ